MQNARFSSKTRPDYCSNIIDLGGQFPKLNNREFVLANREFSATYQGGQFAEQGSSGSQSEQAILMGPVQRNGAAHEGLEVQFRRLRAIKNRTLESRGQRDQRDDPSDVALGVSDALGELPERFSCFHCIRPVMCIA